MSKKIFLSHNHNDKPLVEPVALALRGIYGEENVFYDSWSIKPGEGIIARMNEGLRAPEIVFFFISKSSLESPMVALEWHNALFASTKGYTKLIPVRVDGSDIPPLLKQTVYLDMYSNGLDLTVARIVDICRDVDGFIPQHKNFSNLRWEFSKFENDHAEILISATHYMEPIVSFGVVSTAPLESMNLFVANAAACNVGKHPDIILNNGAKVNVWTISTLGGAIKPVFPFRISLGFVDGAQVEIIDVMHHYAEFEYRPIPYRMEQ